MIVYIVENYNVCISFHILGEVIYTAWCIVSESAERKQDVFS